MAVSPDFLAFIEEQLSGLEGISQKRMFGGVGIFKDGVMFAMIGNDILRFKVDESNRAQYEQRGMTPYQNSKKGKGMPYWEVPIDVLEDKDQLQRWAEQSIAIALAQKK